jgi:hypothetical protein
MTVLPKNVYSRNFQADHQTHILYLSVHGVVQCMKNAVSAQEEQGLEEGVREEVEHPGARTILGACDPQAEDQDHGDSEQRFVHVRDGDRQLAKVKGPRTPEQEHNPDEKADVTHAGRDERFNGRTGRGEAVLLWFGTFVDPEAGQRRERTEQSQNGHNP